jgi:hypothetical protein
LQGIRGEAWSILRRERAAEVVKPVDVSALRVLVLVVTCERDAGHSLQAMEFLIQRGHVRMPWQLSFVERRQLAEV